MRAVKHTVFILGNITRIYLIMLQLTTLAKRNDILCKDISATYGEGLIRCSTGYFTSGMADMADQIKDN